MPLKVNHLIIFAAMGLGSCTTTGAPTDNMTALSKVTSAPLCENAVAEIRIDHPTSRVNACDVISDTYFNLTIRPSSADGAR